MELVRSIMEGPSVETKYREFVNNLFNIKLHFPV
jgi:hypothetical protein